MAIHRIQPGLKFVPQMFNRSVFGAAMAILPIWLRYRRGIGRIDVNGIDRLVDLYHQHQAGKTRFILAFRHPTLNDPPCLLRLFSHHVVRAARRQKRSLKAPVHGHFVYERGIPLWAGGSFIEWLLSRLGATPIYRGKIDLHALKQIRSLLVNGEFPVAIAPEGSINGHNEMIGRLEPGLAQLGFWCVEDLLKAGRFERVVILPIGIHYQYVNPSWSKLESLIQKMEADCGLDITSGWIAQSNVSQETWVYQQLHRVIVYLITQLEAHYSNFYHQLLPGVGTTDQRLYALLDAILGVAEFQFDLQPQGSLLERRHRVEQAGWNWIYRNDIQDVNALPRVALGLANQSATVAQQTLEHMRLAERLLAVSDRYIQEKPSFERLAETALLLWNAITGIKGGKVTYPASLGLRRVQITVAEEIIVSHRWDDYRQNRRGAIDRLTQDLRTVLESMLPNTQISAPSQNPLEDSDLSSEQQQCPATGMISGKTD